MSLKTWGIHHWKEEIHPGLFQGCYFIERPFGNLLVFPPPPHSFHVEKEFPFIESKGGISIQMQSHLNRATTLQKRLYQRFGAPLLVKEDSEELRLLTEEDYDFRFALNGEEYFDPHTEFAQIQGIDCVKIYQREKKFYFLSNDFVLDRGEIRLGSYALTQEDLGKDIEKDSILLFQTYRGQNWISYCP